MAVNSSKSSALVADEPVFKVADKKFVSVLGTNSLTFNSYAEFKAPYQSGESWQLVIQNNNTGPVTINRDSLGVKNLFKNKTLVLEPNDLEAGSVIKVVYDGTNYVIENSSFFAPITGVALKKRLMATALNNIKLDNKILTDIELEMEANTTYEFDGRIACQNGDASGIQFAAFFPGGAVANFNIHGRNANNANLQIGPFTSAYASGTISVNNIFNRATSITILDIKGQISCGPNSGKFQISFAPVTDGVLSQILSPGTWIEYSR